MRKIVRLAPAILGLFLLFGCGRQEPPTQSLVNDAPGPEPMRTALHNRSSVTADRGESGSGQPLQSGAPRLSYTYAYAISGPSAAIIALERKHEAACFAAGPARCVILMSRTVTRTGERESGSLELRAATEWASAFRAGLATETKPVGGRIESSSTRAEDLTHRIVDHEAQLSAKITLRDRLKAMLRSQRAKLSDLADIEEKLAQVQGGIDEMTAELTIANERVTTSTLKLTYGERTGPIGDGSGFRELQQAAANVGSNFASGLAFVISALAWILPALVVIGVGIIVGLGARNRGKSKRSGSI